MVILVTTGRAQFLLHSTGAIRQVLVASGSAAPAAAAPSPSPTGSSNTAGISSLVIGVAFVAQYIFAGGAGGHWF